jgi:hypothetical protein
MKIPPELWPMTLLSSNAFAAQTLSQIHSPGNPSYGFDFNNLCAALSVQLPVVCSFVKLLSEDLGNTCSNLLVDVMESWIKLMSETFPKTAAGIQNVQIDFNRGRELKLQSFVAEFMEKYNAIGLPPPVMSYIGFGPLGRFLHHVIFWHGHILYAAKRNLLLNFQLIISWVSTLALSYIMLPAGCCIVHQRH